MIWPEGPYSDGEGPWVVELGVPFRDALADVDDAALPGLAERWCQIEELRRLDAALALDIIERFVALARHAKESGDRLYCWCCL